MNDTKTELKEIREKLAGITKDVCDNCTCEQRKQPYRCCQGWACDLAIAYADWKWGVQLRHTGHPEFALMGEGGCTAPPHLEGEHQGCAAVDEQPHKKGRIRYKNRAWVPNHQRLVSIWNYRRLAPKPSHQTSYIFSVALSVFCTDAPMGDRG